MKKKLTFLGCALSLTMFAVAIFSQMFVCEEVLLADADVTEITSLSQITDLTKNYRLKNNITLTSNYSPIGTRENPFTGSFDGNGFTISNIKISSGFDYQGVFGYTSGAKISNLKISSVDYNFSSSPASGEYFAGAVVGYADNQSVISNCEVDGETVSEEVKYKLTFGGIVGCLNSALSSVSDVAIYDDFSFEENLQNNYTVKIGGIVGSVCDASKIENVAVFSNALITQKDSSIEGTTYVGGIAGEVSGYDTKIINCVSDSILSLEANGSLGSVVGYVNLSPQSGNITSVAYSQNIDAFGDKNSYIVSNSSTDDYVANLHSSAFKLASFYFDEEFSYSPVYNVTKTFKWYELSLGWQKSVWVVNVLDLGNELRLQRFQKFEIDISKPVDNQNLLQVDENSVSSGEYDYGELVVYNNIFIASENIGFYNLKTIRLNGTEVDWERLERSDDTQSSDVAVYEDENTGRYTLKVISKSSTAGLFSFELEAISFEGRVSVRDDVGGSFVRFAGGTGSKRNFTKESSATSAEARAGSMYVFKNWDLYYQTSSVEALNGEDLKEGFAFVDNLYWKKISPVYLTYENVNNFKYAPSSLSFKFGEAQDNQSGFVFFGDERNAEDRVYKFLDQNFLLYANFELDPYKISFTKENDYAIKNIEKILVNDVDIVDQNNIATVGKSDNISIKVYVNKDFELNLKTLLDSILIDNKNLITTREDDYENGTIYTVVFNTSKLDATSTTEHNRFVFSLVLNEKEKKQGAANLGWIIGGSVAGGVVVIGVIVFLIIYFRGTGGRGGSSKNYDKKPSKKSINEDYKRYYM